MKLALSLAALVLAGTALAVGDVGGSVRDELAQIQISPQFKNVAVVHGAIAGGLQRWKLASVDVEQHIFTIDGQSLDGRVVRETYVRVTGIDPYGFRPGQPGAEHALRDALTTREYADFTGARVKATVTESPLHLVATFYRGKFAAYEVLEPQRRTVGVQDRFEWRSFAVAQLADAIERAQSCDNGEDCAAWF
jgi:hypothetical protein